MSVGKNAQHILRLLTLRKSARPDEENPAASRAESPAAAGETAEENPAAKFNGAIGESEEESIERGRAKQMLGMGGRGKGLLLKYDLAMLVLLALTGLVVIAYLWGYRAGREAALQQRREAAPDAPEKPDAPRNPQPEAADDGPIASPYKTVQVMSDPHFNDERKATYEGFAKKYREMKLQADVFISGEKISLFIGRFRSEDSPKAQKVFESLKREFPGCFWVQR
jgi:hypothetical protein